MYILSYTTLIFHLYSLCMILNAVILCYFKVFFIQTAKQNKDSGTLTVSLDSDDCVISNSSFVYS